MILRNYDNIMTAKRFIIKNNTTILSTDTSTFGDGHINIKITTGNIKQISSYAQWGHLPLSYITEGSPHYTYGGGNGSSWLVCGNGDVAESYDDYKLASIIPTSQVSYISNSSKVEKIHNSDGSWTSIYSIVFSNISTEELKVREVGVVTGFYGDKGSLYTCLVYRKVLEQEVSVPAGANFILSFSTTVSENPNKPANYDAGAAVV